MVDDFCGIKGDEMSEFQEKEDFIVINALVPIKLADIIGAKARAENVPFAQMASQLLIKGIEASRSEKAKEN